MKKFYLLFVIFFEKIKKIEKIRKINQLLSHQQKQKEGFEPGSISSDNCTMQTRFRYGSDGFP